METSLNTDTRLAILCKKQDWLYRQDRNAAVRNLM